MKPNFSIEELILLKRIEMGRREQALMDLIKGEPEYPVPCNIDNEIEDIEEDDPVDYIQWSKQGKNVYFPEGKIKLVSELRPGVYDIGYSNKRETYFAIYKKLSLDELFTFPDPVQDKIIKDIKTFWQREDQFKKYKYAYKRGILLYGSAGNGKSSIINLLCKELVDVYKGVVFFLNNAEDLTPFINFVRNFFRQIQPQTKIICIIEDIESFTYDRSVEGKLLNLLDGMNQMENIVVIATTNYPEELKERILNRPSRFDRRYEIKNPNAEIRQAYFKHKLKEEDLTGIDIKDWVKETKGLTIAHLGEIVKSVFALGNDFKETINELKNMKKKVTSFDFNKETTDSIGFKTTSGDDEDTAKKNGMVKARDNGIDCA